MYKGEKRRTADVIFDWIVKILVAIIGLAGVIGGTIITQRALDKRHREDLELAYKKEIDEMNRKHQEDINKIRTETNNNFDEIKAGLDTLRASVQQYMAVTELKIETLTQEVQKHNNFAARMPVVEEQIKVANHRIEDLERSHK